MTQADTDPCDGLDSPDNLEQQFSKAPRLESRGGVLYAQTQQVGRCQLMVISWEKKRSIRNQLQLTLLWKEIVMNHLNMSKVLRTFS